MLRLLPPYVPGAFNDLPNPALNGSMWTIAYEFRCYIAAAVIGAFGLYASNKCVIFVGLVLTSIFLNATHALQNLHMIGTNIVGGPNENVRFFATFGVGACYFIFKDIVPLTWLRAVMACVLLCALMFNHRCAETAFIILGGYIIFWFAFKVPVLPVSRFDNGTDISYGLYLWAWPIQNLIIWNYRTVNPWLLCALTFLVSGILAFASWRLIEKPCLTLLKKISPTSSRNTDTAIRAI